MILTARQTAERLGVHVETVRRWARTGKIRTLHRFGKSWMFDWETIKEEDKHGDRNT